MLKIKTIGLVAATALALTLAQPKPAEAGNAGKVIAGIAIGAIALGILSHSSRAYAEPHAYYEPQPYAYYPDYNYGYYNQPAPHYRYHRRHANNGPNRWPHVTRSHRGGHRY